MKLVDMTWVYNNDILVYKGGTPPIFRKEGDCEAGDPLEMTFIDNFCIHFGTHFDAPGHMVENGALAEDMPMEYYIGRGIVVDCSSYKPGSKYGMEVLEGVDLSDKEFVFFHIDWAKNWDKEEQYSDYPVMTAELADYLGGLESLHGIGVETNGIDTVGDESFIIHKSYLKHKNKLIYEAVTNLDMLIGEEFLFYGLPIPIKDAEGGITRAFAVVDDKNMEDFK